MLSQYLNSETLITLGIAFILCGSTLWKICQCIDKIVHRVPKNTEGRDGEWRNIKQKGNDQ